MKPLATASLGVLLLGSAEWGGAQDAKPSAASRKPAAANEKFALALYAEIVKAHEGKNVFVSPASVSIALAMTANGAAGDTKKAMEKTLGVEGLSRDEMNEAYAALIKALREADPKVTLEIADSIWVRRSFRLKKDFVERVGDRFDAATESLDFDASSASKAINDWVKKKTHDKIDKIVEDRIDPDAMLFLINAVYLKADWTVSFDKAQTKEMPFHLAGGKDRPHPMMTRRDFFPYLETGSFQSVRIPYGKEKRFGMYLFVPKGASTLSDLHGALTADALRGWFREYGGAECDLFLPRLKLEFSAKLNEALKAMGMEPAFIPGQADFSDLSEVAMRDLLHIDSVLQKTFVDVNEEGTEAAAVTLVGGGARYAHRTATVRADRPFFFLIRDDKTETLLFMGSIVDPGAKE